MRLISFCCLTAFLLPRLLTAQDYAPSDSTGPSKLHLSAYATVNYARYNWDTDPHRRATLDLEWLVVEATYQALPRLAFEAEVEFEHGGTGGEIEFDPLEESGRFASGIDKGGEVVVEEVHATFNLTPSLDLRVGHFYVPVGSLSSKYEPFQYPTVFRPEMEEALLPAQWDETGIKLMGHPGRWHYQLGIVNGLDNSGFSSANWIRLGKQGSFEQIRVEDVAGFGRLDFTPTRGLVIGTAGYLGNTTGNRPTPDLTAPAYVTVAEAHADLERNGWRARGMYLRGWLQNSAAVSAANAQLPEALGVERDAVAAQAMGWSLEVGYDVLRLFGVATGHPAPGLDLSAATSSTIRCIASPPAWSTTPAGNGASGPWASTTG
jgi:hypothetical protein